MTGATGEPLVGLAERLGDRERVLQAIGNGNRTFRVAHALGWSTSKARYYLRSLEQAGRVERDPRYSAANDTYWRTALSPFDTVENGDGAC